MKHKLIFLTMAVAIWPFGATAGQDAVTVCVDESTIPAARACLRRVLERKELELDRATEELTGLLKSLDSRYPRDEKAVALLRDSHKAWKTYRDEECYFTESIEFWGGSARRGAVAACRVRSTEERIRKIERIAAEMR